MSATPVYEEGSRTEGLSPTHWCAPGIERPLTFHSLRHGFCAALAEAGKSAIVTKEAARYASVSTSMIHFHYWNERLRAELGDAFG